MAHFARLDENNIVTEVIVVDLTALETPENEQRGLEWLRDFDTLRGLTPARWVQTSYNNNIRGRYAGVGMVYDEALDEFIGVEPQVTLEPPLQDI
jgi:hypothetical protein